MKVKLIFFLIIISTIFSASVRAQVKGVTVEPVSKLPAKEKRWALIIGVDNYGLRGAVNDARALKNTLVKYAGFPENQIVLLTTDDSNNLPSRRNILIELNKLSRSVQPDDFFLFAFSGHGKTIDDNAYLIPSDGEITSNTEILSELSINVNSVKKAVETMKVKQVMMLIDACRDRVEGRGSASEPLTQAITNGFSFNEANKSVEAFITLYSTRRGEFAYEFYDKEIKQWRGYFSRALEEGLSGKAANENGNVTLAGLVKYIEDTVPTRSYRNEGKKQVPWKDSNNGYKENELILAKIDLQQTSGLKSGEEVFWQTIENSDDAAEFEDYLARTRRGEFAGKYKAAAELKLARFKKRAAPTKTPNEPVKKTEVPINKPVKPTTLSPNSSGKPEFIDERFTSLLGGTIFMAASGTERTVASFSVAKKKVTQAEWLAVMGNNPSYFAGCDKCPVENVSWNQIQTFLKRLNDKRDGWVYRLPTEAEWEYAARAGSALDSIQDLNNNVWHSGNSDGKPHPVGEKKANKWGLFDMFGNVMEWTGDNYNADGEAGLKVVRGCSFTDSLDKCTATRRDGRAAEWKNSNIGFRLVRTSVVYPLNKIKTKSN